MSHRLDVQYQNAMGLLQLRLNQLAAAMPDGSRLWAISEAIQPAIRPRATREMAARVITLLIAIEAEHGLARGVGYGDDYHNQWLSTLYAADELRAAAQLLINKAKAHP